MKKSDKINLAKKMKMKIILYSLKVRLSMGEKKYLSSCRPSGKWGGLIKRDYIAAIKRYSYCLPPLPAKSIIPCEWHLIGKTKLCGRSSKFIGWIRYGKCLRIHVGCIRDYLFIYLFSECKVLEPSNCLLMRCMEGD